MATSYKQETHFACLGTLTGVAPERHPGGRRCSYQDPETGEQCITVLNCYNGREYCLAHDHVVEHPLSERPREDGICQWVFDELMVERLAESLNASDGYVNLHLSFPDVSAQAIANAVNSLRNMGNIIEGRRKADGHDSGYRLEC